MAWTIKFKQNLQFKLLLFVTLVIVVILSIFYLESVNKQKKIFYNSFYDLGVSLANALDAGISSTGDIKNIEKLESNIYKLIWLNSNIISISISLPLEKGLEIVASNNSNNIGILAPPEGVNSFKDGSILIDEIKESSGRNVLRVITPVHIGGKKAGIYTIYLSLNTLEQATRSTRVEFLIFTLFSILIIIVILSIYMKIIVLNPIKQLQLGMENIGSGNLNYKMKTSRRDEFGDLFSGLNDMTQKLNERTCELNCSKSHIEIIVDNLVDGLIEYTKNGEIRRINHTAERLLGISRDEIVGSQILPEQEKDNRLNGLVKIIFSEKEESMREIEITYPLPTNLQIITAHLPVDTNTGSSYVSIIRDITREKLIDKEKTSFISVAAHQMRTPLSAIKWVFSTLTDDYINEFSEKVKEIVNMGTLVNNRMIKLVNDLLDISRIEDGRYGYTFLEGDLRELIENIGIEYNQIIKIKKDLKFSFSASSEIPRFVFDPVKLSIAIHNLLDNAINYTKPGGTVSLNLVKDEDYAVITVADSGIGFTTSGLDKLFTKFFRAENAILMCPNGFGLGLFIVKNIIIQHGGTINATPNTPVGTIFTIRLPISKK